MPGDTTYKEWQLDKYYEYTKRTHTEKSTDGEIIKICKIKPILQSNKLLKKSQYYSSRQREIRSPMHSSKFLVGAW